MQVILVVTQGLQPRCVRRSACLLKHDCLCRGTNSRVSPRVYIQNRYDLSISSVWFNIIWCRLSDTSYCDWTDSSAEASDFSAVSWSQLSKQCFTHSMSTLHGGNILLCDSCHLKVTCLPLITLALCFMQRPSKIESIEERVELGIQENSEADLVQTSLLKQEYSTRVLWQNSLTNASQ